MTEHFNSEINTYGYPSAVILRYFVVLVSYTILSTNKAALSSVHGHVIVENKISGYYLADEIEMTYRVIAIAIAIAIAIEEKEWAVFRTIKPT